MERFTPIELDYSTYKDVAVTYRLYGKQLEAIQELADAEGNTLEEELWFIMTLGCVYDISAKTEQRRRELARMASAQHEPTPSQCAPATV